MCKIKFVYGPDRFFENYIPSSYLSLENYVTLQESEKRNIVVPYNESRKKEMLEGKVVVGKTNSYSSFTIGYIQNFLEDLQDFVLYGDEIVLQNPPQQIVDSVKSNFIENADYKIIKYEYSKITIEIIKSIKQELDKNILGQSKAIKKLISNLYELYRNKDKKPIVIMFYGPSGVGKTETAKIVSKEFQGDFLRIQMSMYNGNTAFDYIFGSDHNKNSMAKDLLNRENNIILLDEFGRSHPDLLSAFYQLFDEGVFEDSNYTVDVSNSVIICTSNFLSLNDLRKTLGDPIYYRFDDLIEFNSLDEQTIQLMIERITNKIYQDLSAEEKEIVGGQSELYNKYIQVSNKFINYRQIDSLIKNDINCKIIDKLFYNT